MDLQIYGNGMENKVRFILKSKLASIGLSVNAGPKIPG
jgi:hypothetical protein